jgi:hypothetical protein
VTVGQTDAATGHRITLTPGAAAQASLGWNATAPAGSTTWARFSLPRTPARFARNLSAVLDIVNGGAVAVTAWEVASR